MLKPNDYDTTKSYGNFEPLAPGGYVCCIRGVVETKSSTNKDMINIYLDILEGSEAGRFQRIYDNDNREDKKWPCIVYQLVYDNEGKTSRGFKTFMDAVVDSNDGFQPVWGDGFCQALQNKIVGTLFRKEEYLKNDGSVGDYTKCYAFRDAKSIREGKFENPKDKLLVQPTNINGPATPANHFVNVPEGADSELPF